MEQTKQVYEAPEVVELGDAGELTLGYYGFNFDCDCDRRWSEPEVE